MVSTVTTTDIPEEGPGMFTERILKSIISLKSFSSTTRMCTPMLEGIHITVDGVAKTITALATDRYAAGRMVIAVPEYTGESWSRNVSIATLNAALATVKASGRPVSVFPEAYMPEFPVRVADLIDKFVNANNTEREGDFNVKYLGAISKVNVGGDKSGRWTIRTVDRSDATNSVPVLVATVANGDYEVTVITM